MMELTKIPDFDSLPKVDGMPQGCAWGIFDNDGQKDVFGTLNFLNPSVVKAAAAEVEEGLSVSLNWPIGALKDRNIGRKSLVHKVLSHHDDPLYPMIAFDDEIEFNTQCSSQWDSLCHFAHQSSGLFYNNSNIKLSDLVQSNGTEDTEQKYPTLQHWHSRGGIVGRGVLLDYKAYADKAGISYSPVACHNITVEALETVAKAQGTTFRPGDILIVRSGFTEALTPMTTEDREESAGMEGLVGVESTVSAAKWAWNNQFAAVAGDMMAFEALPPFRPGQGPIKLVLHEYLLAMFGMPIGELWDLKALSEACAKRKKWTFLLTSVPLNIPGGVGSPSNALAIF